MTKFIIIYYRDKTWKNWLSVQCETEKEKASWIQYFQEMGYEYK